MTTEPLIRLNSDTETRPTAAMREAIFAAEVGDEQRREDPSVNKLCERVATLLGKEAALFLPSGTMCNLIGVKTHSQPGQLLFAERNAHVLRVEGGGAAMVSGLITEPIRPRPEAGLPPGVFDHVDLESAIADVSALPAPYAPPTRLVCVEQTHNFGGGSIWPLATLVQLATAAREHSLAVHMDGARLMNAVVASDASAAEYAACTDSVWIDFTKGLGAPLGAVLAGSATFIAEANRYKTAFGGAMRQAGIAAAGCLYALDHHVDRLADDHRRAARLAHGLESLAGIELVFGPPSTNIVFFSVDGLGLSAHQFAERCLEKGLRIGAVAGKLRAVTHLEIGDADIDAALSVAADVCRNA